MEGSAGVGKGRFPGPAVDCGEMLESGFQTAFQLREPQVLDLMASRTEGLDSGQHLPGFVAIFFREFEDPIVPALVGFDGMLWSPATADLAMVVGFPVALLANSVPVFRREGRAQVLTMSGGRDEFYGKAWLGW